MGLTQYESLQEEIPKRSNYDNEQSYYRLVEYKDIYIEQYGDVLWQD